MTDEQKSSVAKFLEKTGLIPKSKLQSKTVSKDFSTQKAKDKSKFIPTKKSKTQKDNSKKLSTKKTNTYKDKPKFVSPIQKIKSFAGLRVVPLGGMEQVGQNMMFIEWEEDIIVIDSGVEFPSPEHLGVDVLIPDISYLRENKERIRGIIYTHGHLDHIGGVKYILPELDFPPVYATELTKELILAGIENPEISKQIKISRISANSRITLGKFNLEFFHVNHSIPDGVGIVINTPRGAIVHTSDFKFDNNPSDDSPANLERLADIGRKGVLLALVDSTSCEKEGHTQSEAVIEKELDQIISNCVGRIIITTFASNIGRVSKIIESAERNGRTVYLSGRSMEKNMGIARKLKYLKCQDKTIQSINKKTETQNPAKVLILSTGSQGEQFAALTRMAARTHREIKLTAQDTVVFSTNPIIGNERAIVSVLNNLADIGVRMIDNKELDTHVSGHAHADECVEMVALLRPKYFSPIHGEIYMRYAHKNLICEQLHHAEDATFIMKNGQGIVFQKGKTPRLMKENEKLCGQSVMIELGEKIDTHILNDRTLMANGGGLFVSLFLDNNKIKNLTVRSRGFRYMGMKHEIFTIIKKEIRKIFAKNFRSGDPKNRMEKLIREAVQNLLWKTFRKEMMVEVVIN